MFSFFRKKGKPEAGKPESAPAEPPQPAQETAPSGVPANGPSSGEPADRPASPGSAAAAPAGAPAPIRGIAEAVSAGTGVAEPQGDATVAGAGARGAAVAVEPAGAPTGGAAAPSSAPGASAVQSGPAAPSESVARSEAVAQPGPVAQRQSAAQPEPVAQPEAVAQPEPAPTPAPEAAAGKRSWLSRLKQGLSRTGQNLGGLFVGVKVDEDLFEELETALIMADAGIEATGQLLAALRARVKKDRLSDAQAVKAALRDILAEHLQPLEKTFPLGSAAPLVVMIAGVNGAGKTTSIGKLAHAFQAQGASVLLAAADTFRAAAREQLMEWGARNNVTVVAQEGGDPAAVAFDAVNAGRARQAGVVMVDTAGRLPTQLHLMEELKKIKRVIGKADGQAPHEVLLVVDGNTGQNVISQVRAFDAAIGLTGLVVTKLDGTAKGGTLAALAAGSQGVRPIPVYWIGVGEGMHDLQPFVAREFAGALLGE